MMTKGKWVVFDGIDAVGKSLQAKIVSEELRLSNKFQARELAEFSATPTGDLIRDIINRQRFFSFNIDYSTVWTETTLLLSDLCAKAEYVNHHRNEVDFFIADRGIASLLAYQALRISKSETNIDKVIANMRQAYELLFLDLPKPDLHIIYDLDLKIVNDRVQKRGETPLNDEQLRFLTSVRSKLNDVVKLFPHLIIDIEGKSIDEVTKETMEAILQI